MNKTIFHDVMQFQKSTENCNYLEHICEEFVPNFSTIYSLMMKDIILFHDNENKLYIYSSEYCDATSNSIVKNIHNCDAMFKIETDLQQFISKSKFYFNAEYEAQSEQNQNYLNSNYLNLNDISNHVPSNLIWHSYIKNGLIDQRNVIRENINKENSVKVCFLGPFEDGSKLKNHNLLFPSISSTPSNYNHNNCFSSYYTPFPLPESFFEASFTTCVTGLDIGKATSFHPSSNLYSLFHNFSTKSSSKLNFEVSANIISDKKFFFDFSSIEANYNASIPFSKDFYINSNLIQSEMLAYSLKLESEENERKNQIDQKNDDTNQGVLSNAGTAESESEEKCAANRTNIDGVAAMMNTLNMKSSSSPKEDKKEDLVLSYTKTQPIPIRIDSQTSDIKLTPQNNSMRNSLDKLLGNPLSSSPLHVRRGFSCPQSLKIPSPMEKEKEFLRAQKIAKLKARRQLKQQEQSAAL